MMPMLRSFSSMVHFPQVHPLPRVRLGLSKNKKSGGWNPISSPASVPHDAYQFGQSRRPQGSAGAEGPGTGGEAGINHRAIVLQSPNGTWTSVPKNSELIILPRREIESRGMTNV